MQRKNRAKTRVVAKNIFRESNECQLHAVIFDFETFPDEATNTHQVYAAGWYDCDSGLYFSSWGREAISNFVTWVLDAGRERKLKLVGYNNAGFDNNFIISELLRRGIIPSQFKMKGRDLIILAHEQLFYTFDVYRFLPGSSLAAACRDFGVPAELQKSHFPHRFIKSWDTLEYDGPAPGPESYIHPPPSDWEYPTENWNCREQCLKYLKLDVLATLHVFKTLGELFYGHFKVNYTEYITLSHLSFELWTNSVSTPYFNDRTPEAELERWQRLNPFGGASHEDYWIELPKDIEYRFIKRSVIGGMVYPTKQVFESEQYPDVVAGKVTYDAVSHYICPLDVVSLYPHAMRAYPYPSGTPSWALQNTGELARLQTLVDGQKTDLLPLAVMECLYEPNKQLILPAIARRSFRNRLNGDVESDDAGQLSWDLAGGHGVFTSVDILRMRAHGYSVTLVKALVWPRKSYLFREYIEFAKRLKEAGENGNEALRNLGKILLNALYGKMLQMPVLEDLLIATSGEQLDLWLESYDYTDIIDLPTWENEEPRFMYKGEARQVGPYITKPCQLGAFVLSYSRLIMDEYRSAVDPYQLKPGAWRMSLLLSQYYGDTDSMHVEMFSRESQFGKLRAERLDHLIQKGVFGKLWYDLKGEEKVIRAIYLAPKSYILECITKDNKIVYKKKAKGVRSDTLKWEDYQEALETGSGRAVPHDSLKRTGASENPFKVLRERLTRRLLKEKWEGRRFFTNRSSVPLGFVH